MTVLDYILDGLEAELALERELGIRAVAFDRSLLAASQARPAAQPPTMIRSAPPPASVAQSHPETPDQALPEQPSSGRPSSAGLAAPSGGPYEFVFLHHEPLSPAGETMMAKIVAALGKTAETAPVVWEKPIPRARIYVILGSLALRKFQPKLKGAPGQWLKTEKGADVLITYSPHYFLRFKTVTPVLQKGKVEMWRSLKAMAERLRS